MYIRPDSLGSITLHIKTIDGIKSKIFNTKTIVAVGRLSKYGAGHEGKIGVGEFKAQGGLLANIESYDICASCNIIDFQTIRVSDDDKVEKSNNEGGRFDESTRRLIDHAASGDIFIFRKIRYKCPGDDYEKRLNDMTFEIK